MLCVNGNDITYFYRFGAESISKEILKPIDSKSITNIYRIQAHDSIMCGYFCAGFINFMFKGKSVIDLNKRL